MPHIILNEKATELEQLLIDLKSRAEQAHDAFHILEDRQQTEVLTSEELAKMENIQTALSACEDCLTSMCPELQAQFDNVSASI